MITIIDYGLGNVLAFVNVYKRLNIPVAVAKRADDLAQASKLILPGVEQFEYSEKDQYDKYCGHRDDDKVTV